MDNLNLQAIKDYMDQNKLSEQKMAYKMGISYSYLFRVLRGTRQPGGKFISGLIRAGMKGEDIFLSKTLPKGKSMNEPTSTSG